jgi:ATP-dependent helicase/nuclease subunit A
MESEKNRLKLNDEQRAAAFCTENAVVAAGAGSGKTMVLASRFAWLVTEKNYQVKEILTLTFTKKAAAQMYRRIHALLGEIAKEDSGVRGERARKALDDFILARIQTIDSYSAALVKQSAPRYGISPDFTIDENRCRELAIDESLPFLIAHRNNPAMERLYLQKGPEAIANEILASAIFNYSNIDGPICLMQNVQKQFDIICTEWKKQVNNAAGRLKELAGIISADESLLPDLVPLMTRFNSGMILFPDEKKIRDYFDFLLNNSPDECIAGAESHPIQSSITEVLEFMARLNGLNLRKGRKSRNPAKEAIKHFRESVFGEFSSLAVFCLQAGLILSIMYLIQDLQRSYLRKKQTEGVLTFSDVARLARAILLEQEDIRQSEKEAFKAIMIDEFQDNNELQKDMLFLLAEKPELINKKIPEAKDLSPGKLFFVGDEKQSIYRFRGADVSVFRKLKEELQGGDLPLQTNYRSAPMLIGAFNAIFGGFNCRPEKTDSLPANDSVFAPAGDLPLYEAAYTPLRAGRDGEGKLTLCILDKEGGGDSDGKEALLEAVENEARFVAERIQRLLEEKNSAGEAKYRPNDIAILFRTRSPQYFFERHLRLLNIPYASEDLNGFFYGGPINDIMSVLRLAAYPLDRAAYAEMLRSPFAGLSLPGLAVCLASFGSAEYTEPFSGAPLSRLTEDDRIKYLHGQKIYGMIRDRAGSGSVSSLISELWYDRGYRYETEWHPQTAVYRELYDYLFHLAAEADMDNRGLAAFTDSIQALRESDEGLTDIEIPLERPSAVHLLTIHKSKGLEFPVVFLCCCDKHSRWNYSIDIYDTGDAGLTFNPPLPPGCSNIPGIRRNYFWERSLVEEKRKKTAELRRLLYVGMTRAEQELYLTGSLNIGKDDVSGSTGEYQENDCFSPRLQKYIAQKTEMAAGKNTIPGDTILDNDTFFGLCLPSLAAYIAPREITAQPSFFSLEEIPPYTNKYIRDREDRGISGANNQKELNAFFERVESFYQKAEIIHTPHIQNNRLTPTALRGLKESNGDTAQDAAYSVLPGHFIVNKEYSGEDAKDVFDKVDTMLARYADQDEKDGEKFNSGGFGTIAHVCAEALLSGEEAVIPSKLMGFLLPAEAEAFLEAGNELAARFVRSSLGKIARNAKLRKSEFPFRSLLRDSSGKEFFISGTVDLLFEDELSIHVVDFKTDSREVPGEHAAQMACYYRAVTDLFAAPAKKKCRIWLYYLRSGHAVEMTEKSKQINLQRILSAQC